ncbi:AbrB family transcriptional regulator, stage V sporulation protein T [Alkalithermobacter thermoalcaliphilus JW-YL-7 = DSM 7308]|uniref:AbrB family transcriptional regulator, stage V sporulation protein T n=1 Tax=Alkalithermobacter thermoalcaliphilus JW-YL-7 = DSM 7308 TaxID=1121328 RepID=A0A150FU82_CLOPD|nr:transcriptional regulator, AbrB family [[Clostridium] paradoxum JW-YL-7 = DSM 7308]SHK69318.1 AbrB family transcriptional regulator, stage V sporulation protein T [[Clostridium] paradoxum JW-YL-7 = DSM 7308]
MRATGIVRRIDDLGRVVIPKEIRRTLRIKEGDPLEIFTAKDGEVILKKYSPIGELNDFSQEYAETLAENTGLGVVITDLDSIVSVAKLSKKEYKDRSISRELEDLIENRVSILAKDTRVVPIYREDNNEYKKQVIVPIISTSGDAIGAVIFVNKEKEEIEESDEKLAKVAAGFLGKQIQ